LFLDEIGDMPHALQAKVLRLLQEQMFARLGGNETVRTDVRLIAATHRNLSAWSAKGRFRPDLYYRLAVFIIHLPVLRERGDDLLLVGTSCRASVANLDGGARGRPRGAGAPPRLHLAGEHFPPDRRPAERHVRRQTTSRARRHRPPHRRSWQSSTHALSAPLLVEYSSKEYSPRGNPLRRCAKLTGSMTNG